MLFSSLNFIVFFFFTTGACYMVSHRFRWVMLLAASLIFYLFSLPAHTIVLAASILVNYLMGILVDHYDRDPARKRVMIAGIAINLLILAIFRYADMLFPFFTGHSHLSADPVITRVIVPLGISFYTFTNISYLIEVKRRRIPVEKHPGYFACYIAFFPKLIQGPIERPQQFLPQLREKHVFDYNGVTNGIRLMLWGYFKKLVIADSLSVPVNAVFDSNLYSHGPLLVIATVLYAFQIYMDFSGYIDIAHGAGKVLGFRLSNNFNNPYLSKSVKEFWSRWHITLSNWLRDYIFLPLAYFISARMKNEKYLGIATEKYLYSIAITVTFLLCGLWHGVGWNFIAWGGLYAVYLVIGSLTEKPRRRFYRKTGLIRHKSAYNSLQVVITFLLVCFAWIFFRAPGLGAAIRTVSQLFSGWSHDSVSSAFRTLPGAFVNQGLTVAELVFVICLVPCVVLAEYLFRETPEGYRFFRLPLPVRWGVYYLLVLLICYFGKAETNTFIYFRF
ncbi:MAG: MBOAT family O-acyltransferase [Bacteroidota bacterium]